MKQESPLQLRITRPYLFLLQLLSVALLLHFAFALKFLPVHFGLLLFLNLAIAFFPENRVLPFLSIGVGLTYSLTAYPVLANHSTIELFVSLGVVFLLVRSLLNKRPFLEPEQYNTLFRYAVFIVYFLTGFHKLNYGFLDPDTSCANDVNYNLFLIVFGADFRIPPVGTRLLQAATLFVELLVPFGMLMHATRKYAMMILLLFHLYLSICCFSNFSSLGLFLLTGAWLNLKKDGSVRRLTHSFRVYLFFAVLSSLIAFVFYHLIGIRYENGRISIPSFIASVVFATGFLYFGLYLIREADTPNTRNPIHWKLVLPVLVLFVWGIQSYLGLSNRANLTMFSNLISDTSRCNHVIVNTAHTKLFYFEEDKVLIQNASQNLVPLIGKNYRFYSYPFVEFQNRMKIWSSRLKEPVQLELIYRDKHYQITDLNKNTFAKQAWYYRFLYFRETPLQHSGKCMW